MVSVQFKISVLTTVMGFRDMWKHMYVRNVTNRTNVRYKYICQDVSHNHGPGKQLRKHRKSLIPSGVRILKTLWVIRGKYSNIACSYSPSNSLILLTGCIIWMLSKEMHKMHDNYTLPNHFRQSLGDSQIILHLTSFNDSIGEYQIEFDTSFILLQLMFRHCWSYLLVNGHLPLILSIITRYC